MSKELKALEKLRTTIQRLCRECHENTRYSFEYSHQLDIIETALKDYEELKIQNSEQFKEKWVQDNLAMTFELNVARKKLKALEIIKEKMVDVGAVYELDLELYNNYATEINGTPTLTQEEYDLLKEELL